MDIDVLGTFNTVKATVPYLIESAKRNPNPSTDGLTGGRIIYVSASFHYTGKPLQAHVSAAKASVDSIMASVSLEYGPYGITSNVISPGPIDNTEGMTRLARGKPSKEMIRASVPLGRWGTVRDIADATVYLFSDTGNYVNGEVLVVDGANWRLSTAVGAGTDDSSRYPNFLVSDDYIKQFKSGRVGGSKL
jgi:2,4-dienoyl-CoA reductase [(3E)-enoyl-CoA-producing], peroxisomal